MEIRFPEYGNCIANLACSILHYYGAAIPNPTLAQADALLVRFVADGREDNELKRFVSDGNSAQLVMPAVKRCRTLAIAMNGTGPLCLYGMQLHYTPFGTVR